MIITANKTTKKGYIPFQYLATLSGSIMIIACGMLYGWPAPSLPLLFHPDSKIKITSSDGSWLAAMPCIGQPIGNLFAANLVNRIGRKQAMLIVSPIYLASWILVAFASNTCVLYAARVLCGIGDGIAFLTFPMYLGEIADAKVRGLLCSSISSMLVLGFLLIALIGSKFSIRDAALISSVFPIVHFVLFSFMPESPYYLLMKDKPEEATQSLIKLRGDENVTEEFDHLSISVKEDNKNKGKLLDLFTIESNRKAFYVVLITRGLQQFGGQMVITFYATIIFHEAGTDLSSSTSTSIYFGVQVVCAIVCSCLIDKVGRRPLMLLSSVGSCLTLAIQGTYFYVKTNSSVDLDGYGWIPLTALLAYDVFFGMGLGCIPVAILGELFPTSVKAVALCLADMYFSAAVLLATKFFQIMSDYFGMAIPFFVFSGCCALALIYSIFWLPETKGKTLEEIQDYFKGVNKIEKTAENNIE